MSLIVHVWMVHCGLSEIRGSRIMYCGIAVQTMCHWFTHCAWNPMSISGGSALSITSDPKRVENHESWLVCSQNIVLTAWEVVILDLPSDCLTALVGMVVKALLLCSLSLTLVPS